MSDPTTHRGEGTIDCARVMRDEITEQYVAGTLDTADQEAFEQHYFVCSRCFDELRAYRMIRAELERTGHSEVPSAGLIEDRRIRWWPWIAAAAVVILGIAIWRAQRPPDSPPPVVTTLSPAPAPAPQEPVVSLAELSAVEPPAYRPARLRSTPDAPTRRFRDAMSRYQKGDYAGAIEGLEEAVRLDPASSAGHFYLGACQLLVNDPDRAIAALQAAVALGESAYLEEAQFYLAKAFLRKGEASTARAALQKTIGLRGDREAEARMLLDALGSR